MTFGQTFVLVHGGAHGAWCFERLADRLMRAGHVAITPNLPGRAGDPTPIADITLDCYADRLCAVIEAQTRPVILVGHSSAGGVISRAAELCPTAVKKLVFMAALMATDGQTILEVFQRSESPLGAYAIQGQDGYLRYRSDVPLKDILYADVDDHTVSRSLAMLAAEPVAPLTVPVQTTAQRWGRIPRDYLVFTDDRALSPAFLRSSYGAYPGRLIELPGSHFRFLSQPGAVAKALVEDYGGDVDLSPPSPPIAALAAVRDAPHVIASDGRGS